MRIFFLTLTTFRIILIYSFINRFVFLYKILLSLKRYLIFRYLKYLPSFQILSINDLGYLYSHIWKYSVVILLFLLVKEVLR